MGTTKYSQQTKLAASLFLVIGLLSNSSLAQTPPSVQTTGSPPAEKQKTIADFVFKGAKKIFNGGVMGLFSDIGAKDLPESVRSSSEGFDSTQVQCTPEDQLPQLADYDYN